MQDTGSPGRRRFNRRERAALFLASDGRCASCGNSLSSGWHADHVTPHVVGGATTTDNGQALCPPCNFRKGDRMQQPDEDQVELRSFQAELHRTVLDRIPQRQLVTVADAAPGSGKTLAGQHIANELWRRGEISALAVFVPRLNLARQYELDWLRDSELYGAPRMGEIRHRPNKPPLTPGKVFGYCSTYASLTSDQTVHLDWARRHTGRFLLVLDEAQYLGVADEEGIEGGGTKAAEIVREIAGHARHTILLTGTPYRSDGQRLVLATYSEPDEHGHERLISHVRVTYRQGVSENYLRPFQSHLHDGTATWHNLATGQDEVSALSELETRLGHVVRDQGVWAPLADDVANRLRMIRGDFHQTYQALISCTDQTHARAVVKYLQQRHGDFNTVMAVSDDGESAKGVLDSFRRGTGDILVTVRMAFVGYDCKPISIVGVLTNYRHEGHLRQLVARGMRVRKDRPVEEQTVYVIAPDDPQMTAFCHQLRNESEAGVAQRERRERESSSGDQQLGYLADARITDDRVMGLSEAGDAAGDELSFIRAAKSRHRLVDPETKIAALLNDFAGQARDNAMTPVSTPISTMPTQETFEQFSKRLASECSKALRRYVRVKMDILPADPAFRPAIAQVTAAVNGRLGIRAVGDIHTREMWEQRLLIIQRMLSGEIQ